MAIVPSLEAHRAATRRRLTLDLFTRCGAFWADVADLRKTWHVTPRTMLPPEPPFHAEAVGLVTPTPAAGGMFPGTGAGLGQWAAMGTLFLAIGLGLYGYAQRRDRLGR